MDFQQYPTYRMRTTTTNEGLYKQINEYFNTGKYTKWSIAGCLYSIKNPTFTSENAKEVATTMKSIIEERRKSDSLLANARRKLERLESIFESTWTNSEVKHNFEISELKKYRQYWWKTGTLHPKARWEKATLPYELATEVPFDTYVEHTDKYNIHGWWEWENGTVPIRNVRSTNVGILNDGSTTTKTPRTGKEADNSWTPVSKPRLNGGGCDPSGVWRAFSDDAIGALNPTMYEFGTIDRNGNPINLQPGQCIIKIQLACLYHGVPANVLNPPPPPPPQLPPPNLFATLPNPIPIDMFHAQFAILNN
ncbi:hypothetical protein C1645_830316 [Glomus cerebriforme]|uniref:Uncharacterized protein n=1 Tax=Glomus cerebriforme TaxID=658196 RepID=A0A397SNY8_9GLOM|nr:hypothetical protein C1645_830316 [Glomus cerebriforme]